MPNWNELNWIRASDNPDEECIEVAAGEGDLIHLRQTDDPENVVTTTRAKWKAFVLGVQNDEFDHFVEGVEGAGDPEDSGPRPPVSRPCP
jgi:predicted secreted Zn-dependent protease